jgi:hypothetical protein
MTEFTRQEIAVLAGMFAVTNMGQKIPDASLIARAKGWVTNDPNSIAVLFAEQYMETNADERAWTAEVRSWQRDLAKMTREKITSTWPHMVAAFDAAKRS